MKWVIVLLLILLASSATAQLSVTVADIEMRFLADPTATWLTPDGLSILGYSSDPVVEHNPRGSLGMQEWEFSLQTDEPGFGKCEFEFDLQSLPEPSWREYITRARVRDGTWISDWVVSDSIRIFGNPGKPVHK